MAAYNAWTEWEQNRLETLIASGKKREEIIATFPKRSAGCVAKHIIKTLRRWGLPDKYVYTPRKNRKGIARGPKRSTEEEQFIHKAMKECPRATVVEMIVKKFDRNATTAYRWLSELGYPSRQAIERPEIPTDEELEFLNLMIGAHGEMIGVELAAEKFDYDIEIVKRWVGVEVLPPHSLDYLLVTFETGLKIMPGVARPDPEGKGTWFLVR